MSEKNDQVKEKIKEALKARLFISEAEWKGKEDDYFMHRYRRLNENLFEFVQIDLVDIENEYDNYSVYAAHIDLNKSPWCDEKPILLQEMERIYDTKEITKQSLADYIFQNFCQTDQYCISDIISYEKAREAVNQYTADCFWHFIFSFIEKMQETSIRSIREGEVCEYSESDTEEVNEYAI